MEKIEQIIREKIKKLENEINERNTMNEKGISYFLINDAEMYYKRSLEYSYIHRILNIVEEEKNEGENGKTNVFNFIQYLINDLTHHLLNASFSIESTSPIRNLIEIWEYKHIPNIINFLNILIKKR